MTKIIQGKGLQSIVDITGSAPVPTPAAVFDYVNLIKNEGVISEDFAMVDMGGATTDFYSAVSLRNDEKVIRKGIREPLIKRSVEGDLGMRVSALSAMNSDETLLRNELSKRDLEWSDFNSYLSKITAETDYIPEGEIEMEFDSILAGHNTAISTIRHCGTRKDVYTTSGTTILESGRNLKNIGTIIGTGGYLAALKENPLENYTVPEINHKGEEILKPVEYSFYSDNQYLIPLLANAARLYPKEAAASLKPNLKGLYGGNSKQKD